VIGFDSQEIKQLGRNRMNLKRMVALAAAVVLVLAGCSGGDGDTETTIGKTTRTSAPDTTTTVADVAEGAVDNLADVQGAVVRIVAEGSFVDPQYGQQYNAAGSGSGFFISPDGIAVTNNHVVTGAAFLQVYVNGEDEPRNAKVLGVSECSDLAVIDVDGDGYPYLDWYDGDLAVGTTIYAAGFPLGVEEYTLLDGIISKADADGESDWSSVDSVIEHSADTLPGNSGGPIVTEDGKVLAVNYAGDSAGQSYGIGRDEALKVLPTLMDGQDVTSIGINGIAVNDSSISGIWVSSVASGSPADLGGIKGGDVVTLIEGLIPATDGTMADYCDVLRSHNAGDPLSVEVYRPSDSVFMEGTLNTDKELEVSYSFESQLGDEVVDPGTNVTGYDSYVSLADSENILTVDVPQAWSDVDTQSLWGDGQTVYGVGIWASTDYAAWDSGWDTPGMFFGASATLASTETVDSLIDQHDYSSECGYDGRYDYSDELYSGVYDVWTNCGGGDTLFIDLAAETAGSEVLMNVQVVVVTDADLEALDYVLNTFVVDEVALAAFSGSASASSGSTDASGQIAMFENLLDGECFNSYEDAFENTTYSVQVEVVDCASPHEAEVYGNYFFSDTGFPGDDVVQTTADDQCYNQFADYVGNSYENSSLDFWYYYPNESGWNSGINWTMCALIDYGGGNLVGSAWQSGW
jgi:serine protease Do